MVGSAAEAYAELGLPPHSSAEDIRRAYKRACLAHHPDKHHGDSRVAAEAKFKAVVRAYTMLMESGIRGGGGGGGVRKETQKDPFEDGDYCKEFAERFAEQWKREGMEMDADQVFDTLFGAGRKSFEKRAGKVVEDCVKELEFSLEEYATGSEKSLKVRECDLWVQVKSGYRPGDRVRFKNVGGCGDVVVILTQTRHDKFIMKGDDLYVTMKVKLVDALTGIAILLKGVLGEVRIRVDHVVSPGYVHCVRGEGMPKREGEGRGDLFVSFDITFPKRVPMEEKGNVREVLERLEGGMRRSSSLFVGRTWGTANRRGSTMNDDEPQSFGKRRGKLRMPSVWR